MSEFPKSFVWCQDPLDVITFRGPDDKPTCRQGYPWDWPTMNLVISPSKWVPCETPFTERDELTLLRTFRDTVLNAAQVTPNHQLPAAIFAADDVVRRGMRTEVTV